MKKMIVGMVAVLLVAAVRADDPPPTDPLWVVCEGKISSTLIDAVEDKDGFDKAVLRRINGNVLLVIDENGSGSTNYVAGETLNAVLIPLQADGVPLDVSAEIERVKVSEKLKDNKPVSVRELISVYLCDPSGSAEQMFLGTASTSIKYVGADTLEKQNVALSGAGIDPDSPEYGMIALRYNQALSEKLNSAADPAAELQAYINAKLKTAGPTVTLPQVNY